MAEESVVALNALRLAQSLARMLKDMRGLEYRPDGARGRERRSGGPGGSFPLRVGIRYSGFHRGEYVLYMGFETAARLAGLWSADQGLAALEAARSASESLVMEALNAAVGEAIRDLERTAGPLDFEPATAESRAGAAAERPVGAWGEMLILGDAGPVLCCFFQEPRSASEEGQGA
jgi:hypothetical protein